MKLRILLALPIVALALGGCANNTHTPRNRPVSPVSENTLNKIDPPASPEAAKTNELGVEWQGDVVIPGVYRGYIVDGKLVMRKETDPRAVAAPPSSMRFVLGNPQHGEVTYQPAMLEQELAIELMRSREQNARNQQLYQALAVRTNELKRASETMQQNTIALAKQIEGQAAYIKALETKNAQLNAEIEAAKAAKAKEEKK